MDELKVIGIDAKGYGKVYKVVMRNPIVPLTAKALYAYFCSYAGSGTTAFPHREKIIGDLQITKNTFTKHLNSLVDAKYIARKRTAIGNVYEILLTVPNKDGDMIEAKSLGYGTIPKLAMLDNRLSANAKGIYAYLCSYAGSGHIAYPRRSTILRELCISEGKYYRHYTALIESGYVTPTQGTGEKGHYASSVYALNEVLGIDPRVDPDDKQKTASNCDSQKQGYGGKQTDSQKWGYGENKVFNSAFNEYSQKQRYGKKAMSQKQMSRETVPPFSGHPYTTNSSYNKHSSYEEDISNIRTQTREDDTDDSVLVLKKEQSKAVVHYDYLIKEFEAWSKIKNMLGHFTTPDGMADYLKFCKAVIAELTYQVSLFLGRTAEYIERNGKRYEREKLCSVLRDRLACPDDVFHIVCQITDNDSEVRNLRGYVKQTVFNLATEVK